MLWFQSCIWNVNCGSLVSLASPMWNGPSGMHTPREFYPWFVYGRCRCRYLCDDPTAAWPAPVRSCTGRGKLTSAHIPSWARSEEEWALCFAACGDLWGLFVWKRFVFFSKIYSLSVFLPVFVAVFKQAAIFHIKLKLSCTTLHKCNDEKRRPSKKNSQTNTTDE